MMRPMRAFVLLLLTTAGLLCPASAQMPAPLFERVAASVPAREAGWRLVEKQINPSDGSPSGSAFRWTDGSAEVSASVEIHPSLKAARDSFGGSRGALGATGPRRKAAWDEASFWPSKVLGDSACNFRFRKGRVEVWVSAPSEELVRRFARHIAGAISDEV